MKGSVGMSPHLWDSLDGDVYRFTNLFLNATDAPGMIMQFVKLRLYFAAGQTK